MRVITRRKCCASQTYGVNIGAGSAGDRQTFIDGGIRKAPPIDLDPRQPLELHARQHSVVVKNDSNSIVVAGMDSESKHGGSKDQPGKRRAINIPRAGLGASRTATAARCASILLQEP